VIGAHLPALQVVVPLIAAPLCVLSRRPLAAWTVALIAAWLSLGIAIWLLTQVLDANAPISYALGGWAAPWGIEYRVDAANALVLLIVTAVGAVVVPYALVSVRHEIAPERHHLFYAALMLCLAGLLGIAITGDAFNAFVFLEISSLSSYVLISLGPSRAALTAAFRYLILGTIAATFILIGVGLLYMVTGTLNMADLAYRLAGRGENRTVIVAFAFLTVGISLKLALFPLHLWLPNAYARAPSAVSAFLAATATKVAVYLLLRFVFGIFIAAYALDELPLTAILMPLALIAVFTGSLVAIFQDDVRRMLAYSSVAQVGYIVLGIGFATHTGLTASLIHLFNHAAMKGALFLAMGNVFLRLGSVNLDALAGLGRTMPLTVAAFTLAGLSLIGVPATVGFVSKWYLVVAALERGWWPVAALIVVSSLLAVVYIGRVIEVAYFRPPPERPAPVEAPLSMVAPTWILAGACVYFGLDTSLTIGVASRAATVLLELAP